MARARARAPLPSHQPHLCFPSTSGCQNRLLHVRAINYSDQIYEKTTATTMINIPPTGLRRWKRQAEETKESAHVVEISNDLLLFRDLYSVWFVNSKRNKRKFKKQINILHVLIWFENDSMPQTNGPELVFRFIFSDNIGNLSYFFEFVTVIF